MKSLATMTAVAALIAGMSVASAQAPATGTTVSPANPNATATDTKQSGAQDQSGSQSKGSTMQGSGSTAVQSNTAASGAGSVSPADPNAAKVGESGEVKSGMQPKSTQTQGVNAPTRPSTTGTATTSPANTAVTPPNAVK
jgi:hypothetical protein